MPDDTPIWRLLLLAAGCALVSAGVVGLALVGGYLWLTRP
jgi:hypothetical protein